MRRRCCARLHCFIRSRRRSEEGIQPCALLLGAAEATHAAHAGDPFDVGGEVAVDVDTVADLRKAIAMGAGKSTTAVLPRGETPPQR